VKNLYWKRGQRYPRLAKNSSENIALSQKWPYLIFSNGQVANLFLTETIQKRRTIKNLSHETSYVESKNDLIISKIHIRGLDMTQEWNDDSSSE
jgi:hypothetical protein